MKATGIVRRIDDLGRVVIPKEIRRTMRIREGDPLEIYTDREGEVIFKKYSPIGELAAFAAQYAETLHKTCGLSVVICDRDAVIACAGLPRKEFNDKPLSEAMEGIMQSRNLYAYVEGGERMSVTRDSDSHFIRCAMPILTEGDIVGCVVSVCPQGDGDSPVSDRGMTSDRGAVPGRDVESKLIQTAAGFLGKQLET